MGTMAWALGVGLMVGMTMPAVADVVELVSRERVEGGDARAGGDHVTLQVGGRVVIYQRAQVRAIYFGSTPAPCEPSKR